MDQQQSSLQSNFSFSEAQTQQIIFNFVEYLQDLKNGGTLSEENSESVEVATQCLSSAFGVDTNDQTQRQKYSIKPQTLPVVLGMGLSGKEKISNVLEQLQKAKQAQGEANDVEHKFAVYVQSIKKKGYFNGVEPGTAEYEARYAKARQKFFNISTSTQQPTPPPLSSSSTTSSSNKTPSTPTNNPPTSTTQNIPKTPNVQTSSPSKPELTEQQRQQEAEKRKVEGNQKLQSKQYQEAIQCYTEAIELFPHAIYYSNRAAAYSLLGKYEQAIVDCKESIKLDPKYSKAYARLGLAHFSLAQYKEAVDAYSKALELEPSSASLQESLQAAKEKLKATSSTSSPNPTGQPPNPFPSTRQPPNPFSSTGQPPNPFSSPGQGGRGIPDLSQLSSLFGGGEGGPSFADLLNNPELQNLASQFMNNPQMMSMAQNLMNNNPDLLNNLGMNNPPRPNNPNDDDSNSLS